MSVSRCPGAPWRNHPDCDAAHLGASGLIRLSCCWQDRGRCKLHTSSTVLMPAFVRIIRSSCVDV